MDRRQEGRNETEADSESWSRSAIVEDARHPAKYRMLVSMVDVIFADGE